MKQSRPTIALIEDDPLLRSVLARVLDDAAYNVVSAANGAEGLALLERHDVDLAIVDIVMSGHMNGVVLAREAKRHKPELCVIFTSGLPPPTDNDLSSLGTFLPKPTRVPKLLSTIASQLRQRK